MAKTHTAATAAAPEQAPSPPPEQAQADASRIRTAKEIKAEKKAARDAKTAAKKLAAQEKLAAKKAAIKKMNDGAKAKKAAAREAKRKAREAAQAARLEAKLHPSPAQIERAKKAAEAKILKDAKLAARAEADRELVPLAKEINVRIDKANKLEHDADDHRLAAALQLEAARKRCEIAAVNFKKWANENIKHWTYQTVRKLTKVGGAENPTKALTDLREGNKVANQKHRATKKAKAGETAKADETAHGVEGLKLAFLHLKASERMAFAEWAAAEVGATLNTGFEAGNAA